MPDIASLPERGVIEVAGPDRVPFLQGLVSNDVTLAAADRAVWAALLTAQGKYLADFFIIADGARLLLDCEAAALADLVTRLTRYRLRAQVSVSATGLCVAAAWNGRPAVDAIIAADPRLPDAGWRVISSAPVATNAQAADWDRHRLSLGLPDGSRDLERDKTVLLEAGFDELHGVSWTKGCYMGQELTARTRYRGLLKRRLVPVDVRGPLPAPGTPVSRDGAEVGTMRSGRDRAGLAVLRLDALSGGPLACGEASISPRPPGWMRL